MAAYPAAPSAYPYRSRGPNYGAPPADPGLPYRGTANDAPPTDVGHPYRGTAYGAPPTDPGHPYRGTAYDAPPAYQKPSYSPRDTPYGTGYTATDLGLAASDVGLLAATDLRRAAYEMVRADANAGRTGPPPAAPSPNVTPAKTHEEDEDEGEAEEMVVAPPKPPEPLGPDPIVILAIVVITAGGVIALVFYIISRNDLELTSPNYSVATGETLTTAFPNNTFFFLKATKPSKENVTASSELGGTDEYDATSDAASTLGSSMATIAENMTLRA